MSYDSLCFIYLYFIFKIRIFKDKIIAGIKKFIIIFLLAAIYFLSEKYDKIEVSNNNLKICCELKLCNCSNPRQDSKFYIEIILIFNKGWFLVI